MYPYRSLKFIYVFIGELVPKHDGLSSSLTAVEEIPGTTESKLLVYYVWLELSSQLQAELQSCSNCNPAPQKLLCGGVCLDQYSMLSLRKRMAGLGVLHLLFLASQQRDFSCRRVCWKA